MTLSGSAGRARVVRPRRRSDPNCALADLDHRVLGVLCEHRVVRQDQLGRLFPEVPERTLRYRTRRLHQLGLAGRSRPYRERGSAPNHHWPTRRADALVCGETLPRGGERHVPNPVFLAHAAALTELYVAFATDSRLALTEFRREPREPFSDSRQDRVLAPDALLVFANERQEASSAFVEIDLGTMSHTRLRLKADLYAAFATADAWRERYEFMPALLFLTTTDARASKFLAALRAQLAHRTERQGKSTLLVAAAGELALTPGRMLDQACLTGLDGESRLALIDVLNQARAPFDRAREIAQKRARTIEQKQTRLQEDPLFARECLRRGGAGVDAYLHALDPPGCCAVEMLKASESDPLPQEGEVLLTIARELQDVLIQPGFRQGPPPGQAAKEAIERLVACYRASQSRQIDELDARYGEGPGLRRAHHTLDKDGLIDAGHIRKLPEQARRDAEAWQVQRRCMLAYLQSREQAAHQLVKQTGRLRQLAHSREEFYPRIDREQLRVCGRCKEIVYPEFDPSKTFHDEPQTACHYCRGRASLKPYEPNTPIDEEPYDDTPELIYE
jgi:hypothetical protein